jgi:hypothetical protein
MRRLALALLGGGAVLAAACTSIIGFPDVGSVAGDGGTGHDANRRDSGMDGSSDARADGGHDAALACDAAGQTRCGAECVDEQSDTANCGGCGVVCGGKCASGRCAVTLASGQNEPTALVVDDTNVYWIDRGTVEGSSFNGSVMTVPVGGGTVTTFAAAQNEPLGIAIDSHSLYWSNSIGGTLVSGALDGGALSTLYTVAQPGTVEGPESVAVNSQAIFWTDGEGDITRTPRDGGSSSTLLTGAEYVGPSLTPLVQIASDGTSLYALVPVNPDGGASTLSLLKVPMAGGTPTTLASDGLSIYTQGTNLVLSGTRAYWGQLESDDSNTHLVGRVQSVALDGGALTPLATGQLFTGALPTVAVDDTSVYWSTVSSEAIGATVYLVKAPLSGGTPTTLFSGDDAGAVAITTDATSVYWTTGGRGTVMKLTPK